MHSGGMTEAVCASARRRMMGSGERGVSICFTTLPIGGEWRLRHPRRGHFEAISDPSLHEPVSGQRSNLACFFWWHFLQFDNSEVYCLYSRERSARDIQFLLHVFYMEIDRICGDS